THTHTHTPTHTHTHTHTHTPPTHPTNPALGQPANTTTRLPPHHTTPPGPHPPSAPNPPQVRTMFTDIIYTKTNIHHLAAHLATDEPEVTPQVSLEGKRSCRLAQPSSRSAAFSLTRHSGFFSGG